MNENTRPSIISGTSKVGYTSSGLKGAIDGDESNARTIVAPDGIHFQRSDFSDFAFDLVRFMAGNKISTLAISDKGELLIDGVPLKTGGSSSEQQSTKWTDDVFKKFTEPDENEVIRDDDGKLLSKGIITRSQFNEIAKMAQQATNDLSDFVFKFYDVNMEIEQLKDRVAELENK